MIKNECNQHDHGAIASKETQRAFGISPILAIGVIQDSVCFNWHVDCKFTSYCFLFFRLGVCTITTYEKPEEDWEVDDVTEMDEMFSEDQKS